MPNCVGVRFDNGPKVHYLEVPVQVPEIGARFVVTTRRGLELGLVRTGVREHARPSGHVVRAATPSDLARDVELKEKAEELKWLLKARARERKLAVKIVQLEFTLDEAMLLVTYSTDQQLSLRALAHELTPLTGARLEFDNVGPRDQARIIGTLGVCGSGSCSSTWLQSFSTVSIRMARDQQLPLNPEKISGPCGRLMCCLQYEHDMYHDLLADLPKKGSKACHTDTGACGRVIKLNALKGTVEVAYDEGGYEELPPEKLQPAKQHPRRNS